MADISGDGATAVGSKCEDATLSAAPKTIDVDGVLKNSDPLICPFCKSKIVAARASELVEKEYDLPLVTMEKAKLAAGEIESERVAQCWLLKDMFDFDNVGFTRPVEGSLKYLTCADCERGPIGWHNPESPKEFFVAVVRVESSP